MSKYTTQLRWIVEQMSQGLPTPTNHEYPDAVYKYIGLDKYPIFDENYRYGLNDKIINHFYFREIGFETAAQFAWYLRRTMNEIMPKYNALYVAQLTIDMEHPLSDYFKHKNEEWDAHVDDDIQTTNDVNVSESTSTSDTNHNRNVFQDTPMSLLSNEGSPSIENLDYATTVTYDDGNGTSQGTRNSGTDSEGSRIRDKDDTGTRVIDEYGNRRSWAALMDEFAEKWVNIDMLVINDLEDLFFGLW